MGNKDNEAEIACRGRSPLVKWFCSSPTHQLIELWAFFIRHFGWYAQRVKVEKKKKASSQYAEMIKDNIFWSTPK